MLIMSLHFLPGIVYNYIRYRDKLQVVTVEVTANGRW